MGLETNHSVQNMEGLVNEFKNKGVTILDSLVTYSYGKFVHIVYADANKIEF